METKKLFLNEGNDLTGEKNFSGRSLTLRFTGWSQKILIYFLHLRFNKFFATICNQYAVNSCEIKLFFIKINHALFLSFVK